METDFKTIFAGIAVILSVISLFIARKSFEYSKESHQENKRINYDNFITSESKYYIELYSNEHIKFKQFNNDLSTVMGSANRSIGELFELYENKYKKEQNISQALRHIYVDTHELISKVYEKDLSWQTPEYIYNQMNYFRNIHIDLDLKRINEYILNDERIKNNLNILSKSINKEDGQKIYDDFLLKIKPVNLLINDKLEDIKKSIQNLEEGLDKNKAENFDLQENYKLYRLYRLYKQLLNHLKMIERSWIKSLLKYDKTPFLPIIRIVYIGANMTMINELIFRVNGSYWKI